MKIILFVILSIGIFAQDISIMLQQKIETIQQRDSVYGITAAVMVGDDLIWRGTAGYSNPFTMDTLTTNMTASIGSNTKMFTSVIILQLVEEGKLSLDETVDNWFTPTGKIKSDEITVRQLLNHTSGIADYTTGEWIAAFKADPSRSWTFEELVDEFVGESNFEPGESWSYTNTGYYMLGKIIEQLEEKSYREVLYERIITPHELNSMYTPIVDEPTGPEITPWVDFEQNGNRVNVLESGGLTAMHTSAWAAGYIYSTPADLAKFEYLLFNDYLINANSLSDMMSIVEGSYYDGYGLGLIKTNYFGPDLYGHNGQYIGYTARLIYEPETDLSVVLFTNCTYVDIEGMGHELAETAYDYILTDVENDDEKLLSFELSQNYPNPFNPSTKISYSITKPSNVSLVIYNMLGRKVAELVNEEKSAGTYEVNFDARELSSGIYFYRLTSNNKYHTRKMLLLK